MFHYSTLLIIYKNEKNLAFNKNKHGAVHEIPE